MPLHEVPLILNSQSATSLSDDGSTFTVSMENPIILPHNIKSLWLEVQSAEVPYTAPNVFTGSNDILRTSLRIDGVWEDYVITFPQGIYDLDSINLEINRQIPEEYKDTIKISANEATQKAILIVESTVETEVDFTVANSIASLLGFDAVSYTTPSNTYTEYAATNKASINANQFFLIHCDLARYGIRFNDEFSQIVAQVLIDALPGDLILHRPFNVPRIRCWNLLNTRIDTVRVWLTNQNNELVNTAGEFYTVSIVIKYII